MDRSDEGDRVWDFYSTIARPYDIFASSRIFASLRREAVDTLDLDPGDRILDVGCGTGGNLAPIDRALEGQGSYVGIDAAAGMLRQAKPRHADTEIALVQADAMDPPVTGKFDAVLVTFVNGVLENPATAVERWTDLVEPGGRIALLDAAARRGRSTPIDWGFETFVYLAAPPGTRKRHGRSVNEVLVERVTAAHDALEDQGEVITRERRWFGFVRLTTAVIR